MRLAKSDPVPLTLQAKLKVLAFVFGVYLLCFVVEDCWMITGAVKVELVDKESHIGCQRVCGREQAKMICFTFETIYNKVSEAC